MKSVTLFAEGVGELSFDSRGAVVSALEVGYPEMKRVVSDTPERSRTLSLGVGDGKLTLEGYFINSDAISPSCASIGGATAARTASNDTVRKRFTSRAFERKTSKRARSFRRTES